MSHTPHELPEEFPEHAEKMIALKQSDSHFAKIYADYHEINEQVHRAEDNIEPTDQFHEEDMRKQRALLKDEIYRILSA
ncbi:DUF465 domain-containing protein [Aliiroseovarius subalbicans]|uniref:YdcH family protein n=1 Tax=Aliiroseovarius subalbicans TaxID=2925840 RepID=UPI001F55CECE|nr:DUF465 domain-containing protein [Aliiroseovarius subalbicans]MCI2400757.1 DUF465 domain-containing protein [Aliiroseovarius subalbicans]